MIDAKPEPGGDGSGGFGSDRGPARVGDDRGGNRSAPTLVAVTIDIEAVRADTPGCTNVIHLNNAGAALPPAAVVDAVIGHLRLEAEIGGYEAHDAAVVARRRTYEAGAALLGCAPSELAITTGASEAWWRAFQAVPLQVGDRVLASRAEYNANAFALIQAAQRGIEVEFIDDDEHGQIDLDKLADRLDERVKLVTLTHVPTSGGLVNPAEAVGTLVEETGALYLVDACQSAGQRPLDVDQLRCDMLALTGRKFLRGPRGTGMLYVRAAAMAALDDPTFIDSHSADWIAPGEYRLRSDATRFELFESSIAAQIGLGVAAEYALGLGVAAIQEQVQALADAFRSMLGEVPGARLHDRGVERSGIVVFTVDGHPAPRLSAALRERSINTSVASAITAQLDLGVRGIDTAVRASVHYYNTEAELEATIAALLDLTTRRGR